MAILIKQREMDHTQRMLQNSELTVYKLTPEQMQEVLKGGKLMGRPKGSKNKATNIQKLNSQIEKSSKKQSKKAAKKEVEVKTEEINNVKNENEIMFYSPDYKNGEPVLEKFDFHEEPSVDESEDTIERPKTKLDHFKGLVKIEFRQSCINVLFDIVNEELDNCTVESLDETLKNVIEYCNEIQKQIDWTT